MRSYEQTLKLFARYLEDQFGIKKIKEIKAEHLRAYVRYVKERGKYVVAADDNQKKLNKPENRPDYGKKVSDVTIANYVRNIKAFYSYLEAEQIIRRNPMTAVKNIKPKRQVKIMLTDTELKQFFRAFDVTTFDQYRDWITARVILDTGARISELLATVPADIDLRGNAILLRETKSKKERFVYFSDQTRRHLRNWLNYRERYIDSDYVFPSNRGNRQRLEGVERSFRLRSRDVGLQVTPHLLRNQFAKMYLMNGGDLATLSRLLGHSSVEVTAQIYLDYSDKELMTKYKKHSPLSNLDI